MATRQKPAETRSVEELLAELSEPVHYDVARGLERHRRLIAAGAALPEWARPDADPQLVRSAQARRFRKRGWWAVWALSLAFTVRLAATTSSEPDAGQPRASAATGSDAIAARSLPDTATPSGSQLVARGTRRKLAPESAQVLPVQREPTTSELPGRAESERARGVEATVAREPLAQVADAGPTTARPATHADRAKLTSDARPSTLERAPQTNASLARASATSRGAAGHGKRRADSPLDAEEMKQLNRAEQLLAVAPLQTLKLVRAGELKFRSGYFAQERRYLEVMALFALERGDEAQSRGEGFLRDYPDGPYRRKVELALLRHATR
ncbi:MAG: Fe-S oxidoreductase [Myxococcaceae bacterium]|nr:Fe-S oxidoreductase [Myxococcaceae bacterium]